MKTVYITRTETGDEGTFGRAVVLDEKGDQVGQGYVTLECPWRNNARGISCFPAGEYLFKLRADGKRKPKPTYEEWDDPKTPQREDVPDRDYIQLHSANLAGDKSKGFVSQLEGCVAFGEEIITFRAHTAPAGDKDQRGLALAKSATERLYAALGGDDVIKVSVNWAPGVLA
jgi:hypothetical protein